MRADDKRHGTQAGYRAHHRDGEAACDACKRGAAANQARYDLARLRGHALTVDSTGTRRRIQALHAIGWTWAALAPELGITRSGVGLLAGDRNPTSYASTAQRVAEVYERLCMAPPVGSAAKRARTNAARQGWLPPLAWEDIDDPGEQPAKVIRRDWHRTSRADVDEVVVDRLLHLRPVESPTQAEKHEAMRRWLAAGKSEKALCAAHGWREGRYGRESKENAA